LPDGISFRVENQRSRADDGRREDKIAASVENAEENDDTAFFIFAIMRPPIYPRRGVFQEKSIREHIFKDLTMCWRMFYATRWQQNDLFLLIITGFE